MALETLGTRIASGFAATTAVRSSEPHSVSSALTRTTSSRAPNPPFADRRDHRRPSVRLRVGHDRILKVQDHHVRRQRPRLLGRAGVRRGEVQGGVTGAGAGHTFAATPAKAGAQLRDDCSGAMPSITKTVATGPRPSPGWRRGRVGRRICKRLPDPSPHPSRSRRPSNRSRSAFSLMKPAASRWS